MTRGFVFAALACLLFGFAAPAAAQSGLGSTLDDPSGRAPARRRAPSSAFADPSADDRDRPPMDDDDVRVPPPPGAGDPIPSPPGYGEPSSTIGDARLESRLRALDASWAVLGTQGLNYTNAILSLVVGAAQVVIGAVFLEVGGGYELVSPILMVTGGVQIVRTIVVDFILRPNPQPIAIEYASMPAGTRAQRLARLRYGEAQLEALAEQSAILRYVDSGINIAGAAALVGAYFGVRDATFGGRDFDPIELVFFVGPAISLVVSLINLFTPSNTERRWEAYRQMRERTGGDLTEIRPILGIDPNGGGFAGLGGMF